MENEKKDLLAAMEGDLTDLERTVGLLDLVKAVVAETQALGARVAALETLTGQLAEAAVQQKTWIEKLVLRVFPPAPKGKVAN